DAAVAPDAECEGGMEAARVQLLRRTPDAIPRIHLDVELARCDLGFPANAGDGVEIARNDSAGVEQHASLALYEGGVREARSARSATGNGGAGRRPRSRARG